MRRIEGDFQIPLEPGKVDQRRRITVEEAEAECARDLAPSIRREKDEQRREQLRKPMGFNNESWEKLKKMMVVGDELWEFCTSKQSWREHMGMAGYELVRDGQVIDRIIGKLN